MNSEDLHAECTNHSGDGETLTRKQTYSALCMCGKNPMAVQIAAFFQGEGIEDEDGTITFEQFETLYNSIEEPTVAALEEAFKTFDKDDSGTIDKEELKEILQRRLDTTGIETDLDDESVDAILNAIDTNEDGTLSYNELATYLNTHGHLQAQDQE
ncbi:neo-calmodulin-like [Mercenaria mercenaria]|uniref:neo-calmodulin-like n=1 Tax=Mercenaria mercenaria TaxID=6596 RepID=UPI001E1D225B|nr:neo-calmodulin-like [Mercenaria mercenaria]